MKYVGLNDAQVNESRKLNGENVLHELGRGSLSIFYEVVREPMVLLLITASLIYFFTRQYQEGFIMIFAIACVSGISIYQQIRSEKAVQSLRKLTQAQVTVVRNGKHVSVFSEDIVVGDLMIISEGQEVPADSIILEQNDLTVDESILTGESFPVEKSEKDNLIYAGTTIATGLAHARVTLVGNNTRIGKLGIVMEGIRKEKTQLQLQVNRFVRQMALLGVVAFLIVTLLNYFESGDLLHGIMHGLVLAMAVLPEEIPVALSTFMALGAYQMIRNNILAKHPQTVEALGAATVICVDKTGTVTENKMTVVEIFDFESGKILTSGEEMSFGNAQNLLLYSMLASEPLPFDPMEKAIHAIYEKYTLKKGRYEMVNEYPLSGSPPIMTHVYTDEQGKRIIVCKGSPEGVIRNSLLTDTEKEKILGVAKKMAQTGNRVLGVGISDYAGSELPKSQHEFKWRFSGLLALSDPPRSNMKTVIKSFHDAGIEVKMITGDFPETACSIAGKIGIRNTDKFLTGQQVLEMNEEELKNAVSDVNVFARVMPETKLKIISALKSKGEVVAMTGDGVNDGPALKAAHIGIAMGNRGSEVARQAASLVLTNDDLSNMVTAVGFGRKIYTNLKQAVQYIISIHIPLISIVTLPLLFGWKFSNIFTPVHIIFLELVMGPTCSIVYENEPMDKSLLKQKPRKLSTTFFTWRELSISVLQGAVIAAGLMLILYLAIEKGTTEDYARTLVFTVLIFSNIVLTLTGRSRIQSVFRTLKNKNYLVPLVIFLTLGLLMLSVYYAPMQKLFSFVRLSGYEMFICFVFASAFVLWIELYKYRYRLLERRT